MLVRFLSRLFAVALLLSGSALAQGGFAAGRDYWELQSPLPTESEGIEVLEFFAYGCIHCFTLEAKLEPWAKQLQKDVKFRRVPTPFRIKGVESGPIYYTLEAMNLLDKLHVKLFHAIHNENLVAANPTALAEWLTKHGVDVKKYQEIEKSFSVQSKISRARMLTESYKIESTPTLAVSGKYMIVNQVTPERVFQIADSLIANARQTMSAPPALTPAKR